MSKKYPGNVITANAPAGYSVAFNGSTDYLSVANNAAFDLGTGDCTVETWVYLTAGSGALRGLITAFPSGGTPINGWGLYINASNFVYLDTWVAGTEQTYTIIS